MNIHVKERKKNDAIKEECKAAVLILQEVSNECVEMAIVKDVHCNILVDRQCSTHGFSKT